MKVTSNKQLKLATLLFSLVILGSNFAYADKLADKLTEKSVDEKTPCEYADQTLVDVLTLESESLDTQQKIEKVEATIDEETDLRESIFSSVKDFFGLGQTDKEVLADMKKNIADAKDYYAGIDDKVAVTSKFLDENLCENLKLEKASRVASTTAALVDEESDFRRQLVTNLKEKLKIIQVEVKNAKK